MQASASAVSAGIVAGLTAFAVVGAGLGAFTLRRWTAAGERIGDSARSAIRVAVLGAVLLAFVVWAFFDAISVLGP